MMRVFRGLWRGVEGRPRLFSSMASTQEQLDKVCSIFFTPPAAAEAPPVECEALNSLKLDLGPRFVSSVLLRSTDSSAMHKFFKWAQQQNSFQHEPGAYEAMLQVMLDYNTFEFLDSLLEDVVGSCRNLSSKLFNLFLSAYMQAGFVDKAFEAFSRLARVLKPNTNICNCFLEKLLRLDDFKGCSELLQLMMLHAAYPDDATFRLVISCKRAGGAYQLFRSLVKLERLPSFGLNQPLMNFICQAANAEEVLELAETIKKGTLDLVTCNSILHSFRSAGKFDDAQRFFELVSDKGCVNPDDTTYKILILVHCQAGNIHKALELFKTLQGIASVDVKSCNIMVDHLCKSYLVDDAAEIVHGMMEKGPHPDSVTCNSLLDGLFKVNKVDHAMKLFEKMTRSIIKPDAYTYNILLHGLCGAGRIDEACEQLSRALREMKVWPQFLYDALVGGLCKAEKYEHAMAVFRKVGIPSLIAYNTIIASCVRRNCLSTAVELYEEMKSKRRRPDIFTYNTLIQPLCKSGKIDDALKLLEEMIGFKCSPDRLTLGCLVDGLCRAGRSVEAEKLVEAMKKFGCGRDVIIVTALIGGHFREGRADDALRLFGEMQRDEECKPSLRTWNIMIHGLCRARRIQEADKLMELMRGSEAAPDEFTFNTLIDGHLKMEDCAGAEALYQEMVKCGCSRSSITYNTLIDGFCKAGATDKAVKLLQSPGVTARHATTFMYNSVIGKLAKLGKLDKAMQMLEQMGKTKSRCSPDSVTYTSLIVELCRQQRVDRAMELLNRMTPEQIHNSSAPNLPLNVVLNSLCKSGKMEAAEKLCSMKLIFDVVSFNTMIDGFYRAGRTRDGELMFREMLQHGCAPHIVSYNSLLSCLCSEGRVKEACEMLPEMRSRGCHPDVVTFNLLIRFCCKDEKLDEACELTEQMLSANLWPSASTCSLLASLLLTR